jgi:hypothetical protein
MRVGGPTRGAFHRSRAFAPRRPFERPAPALCRHHGVATAMPDVDDLWPGRILSDPVELDPRSREPLPADSRFSGSRRRSPISATDNDARAHPSSHRSSHASGALAPLLAGTNRCRLRWPGDASPHRGPANHDLHATACARRVPLAWTEQVAGRSAREKALARCWTTSRVPSSLAPRAPVSPARRVAEPGLLRVVMRRPRPTADAASRKAIPLGGSGCLLPRRNPYASARLSLRARPDQGPVTPPPQRHCSGARAPLLPPSRRLPLTKQAPGAGSTRRTSGTEAPLVRRVAAPVTASTTDSD